MPLYEPISAVLIIAGVLIYAFIAGGLNPLMAVIIVGFLVLLGKILLLIFAILLMEQQPTRPRGMRRKSW